MACVYVVLKTVLGFNLLLTTVAEAPSGPPQDVSAVAISPRTVQVTWNDVLVAERNGILTEYEVQYEQFTFSQIPQLIMERVAADLEDELTLYDLEEYVEYMVRVRAYNGDGDGPFSPAVTVMTYQDVPSSTPQNLTITATVPNELTVAWDRPPEIDINGVLTFYSLRYHIVGSEDFEFHTVNGSLESTALRGLDNYTTYEVFIAASSINGTGPFTNQRATTSENVPGAPPQNITVNSSTLYSIDIEWRPPDEVEWNGVLRGYQLRYTKANSSTTLIDISGTNQTYYRLLYLQSSTFYCIQVAAVTIGPGTFSLPVCVTTPAGSDISGSGSMISGSGDSENGTTSSTTTVERDGSVPIIAASVVAVVLLVGSVAVLAAIVAAVGWRRQRIRKTKSLAHYLTLSSSQETFSNSNQSSSQSSVNNPQHQHTALVVANPIATTLGLQSYPLPAPPTDDYHHDTTSMGGDEPSSTVRIANNPQYRQFSSQPISGGVVSVGFAENNYDYPTTFQRPVASNTDPYTEVRTTSHQDPPYETIQ